VTEVQVRDESDGALLVQYLPSELVITQPLPTATTLGYAGEGDPHATDRHEQ
jgi:hypothetical protein